MRLSSKPTVESSEDHCFSQSNPRFKCRHARYFKDISDRAGHLIRCRRWHCSRECRDNAAIKASYVLSRHWNNLHECGLRVYRGCLKLRPDASPDEHRIVKERFLLAMRRWAKRHGYRVELFATMHITSPTDAHYDISAWTDGPHRPLHDFFGKAWKRAGGYRQSLVPMIESEYKPSARYLVKDAGPAAEVASDWSGPDDADDAEDAAVYASDDADADDASDDADPGRYVPYVPARHGLDFTWNTAGYWNGTSMDGVWCELIHEWFPDAASSHKEEVDLPTLEPEKTPVPDAASSHKEEVIIPTLLDDQNLAYVDRRHIPGADFNADVLAFVQRLPRSAEAAVLLPEYADAWGVSVGYMRNILRESMSVRMVNGAWYRDE